MVREQAQEMDAPWWGPERNNGPREAFLKPLEKINLKHPILIGPFWEKSYFVVKRFLKSL